MQIKSNSNILVATLRSDFSFAKSRELMLACKVHAKTYPSAQAIVTLENIVTLETCALATLSLISDWMPGGLQIHLNNCSAEVQRIFKLDLVNNFIKKNSALNTSVCLPCLENNKAQFVKDCVPKKSFINPT